MSDFVMHWPQWVSLTLMMLSGFSHALNHGEPRKDKWNFHVWILCAILSLFILYSGGYFTGGR